MRFRAGRILAGVLIAAAVGIAFWEWVTSRGAPGAHFVRWEYTRRVAGDAQTWAYAMGFMFDDINFCLLTGLQQAGLGLDPHLLLPPGTGRLDFLDEFPLDWATVRDSVGPPARSALGIAYVDRWDATAGPARLRMRIVSLDPLVAPVLLLAWPAYRAVARVGRAAVERRRRARGLCLACGYDLVATLDRCLECGSPVVPSPPTDVPVPRR